MMLNLVLHLLHSVNQFILWVSIIFFYNYSNYSINWFDIYTRILNNEFYLNSYYFLWTSFWYIPLLMCTIIFYKYYSNLLILNSSLILSLIIIWVITIVDLHFYWLLNTSNTLLMYKSDFFNNLLLNSINKFHPGLLYWTGLSIIPVILCFTYVFNYTSYLFKEIYIYKLYALYLQITAIILSLTLAFGGWWALQEGSWGGWWNWDPSEVFGLVLLLFFIIYLHQRISKQLILYNYTYIYLYIMILTQIYFFTQLNFDLVSHNFGTKIDNFIDNTNLYTLIVIFSLILTIYYLYKYINTLKLLLFQFHQKLKFTNTLVWTNLIQLLYFYIIIYSLIPLLNDFLWKIANINILNYILVFEKINLQILYLLLIYFWEYKIVFLFLICTNWISLNLTLLPYLYINNRLIIYFHWSIVLFIWLSLLSLHFNFVLWDIFNSNWYIVIEQTLCSVNNLVIDSLFTYFSNISLVTTWNTVCHDTTHEVYSFVFNLYANTTSQEMITGMFYNQFIILIYDILSYNFIIQLSLIFICIWLYIYKPFKIIF